MMDHKLKTGEILHIREAVPDDAAELLDYMNAIGGESDNLLYGAGDIRITEAEERDFLQRQLDNPSTAMFLGEIDGDIVCSAQIGRQGNRSRTAHCGQIAIAVSKAQWNKGVGTCMMQQLVLFGRSLDLEQIELEVKSDNAAAIALYKKTGFQKNRVHSKLLQVFFRSVCECRYYGADSVLMNSEGDWRSYENV